MLFAMPGFDPAAGQRIAEAERVQEQRRRAEGVEHRHVIPARAGSVQPLSHNRQPTEALIPREDRVLGLGGLSDLGPVAPPSLHRTASTTGSRSTSITIRSSLGQCGHSFALIIVIITGRLG